MFFCKSSLGNKAVSCYEIYQQKRYSMKAARDISWQKASEGCMYPSVRKSIHMLHVYCISSSLSVQSNRCLYSEYLISLYKSTYCCECTELNTVKKLMALQRCVCLGDGLSTKDVNNYSIWNICPCDFTRNNTNQLYQQTLLLETIERLFNTQRTDEHFRTKIYIILSWEIILDLEIL